MGRKLNAEIVPAAHAVGLRVFRNKINWVIKAIKRIENVKEVRINIAFPRVSRLPHEFTQIRIGN